MNAFLEQPDDAALELAHTDPIFAKSFQVRQSAMRAVVELDHNERWRDALKYTSRSDRDVFSPAIKFIFGENNDHRYQIKVDRQD